MKTQFMIGMPSGDNRDIQTDFYELYKHTESAIRSIMSEKYSETANIQPASAVYPLQSGSPAGGYPGVYVSLEVDEKAENAVISLVSELMAELSQDSCTVEFIRDDDKTRSVCVQNRHDEITEEKKGKYEHTVPYNVSVRDISEEAEHFREEITADSIYDAALKLQTSMNVIARKNVLLNGRLQKMYVIPGVLKQEDGKYIYEGQQDTVYGHTDTELYKESVKQEIEQAERVIIKDGKGYICFDNDTRTAHALMDDTYITGPYEETVSEKRGTFCFRENVAITTDKETLFFDKEDRALLDSDGKICDIAKKNELSCQKPVVKHIYVHNGLAHMDDMLAAVLLTVVSRKHGVTPEITRTRDEKTLAEALSDKNSIVCDVGLGRYDHHTNPAKGRLDQAEYSGPEGDAKNGIKKAAVGLVLEDFKDEFPADMTEFINRVLVPIEALDNGQKYEMENCAVAQLLEDFGHSMMPVWDEDRSVDDAFTECTEQLISFVAAVTEHGLESPEVNAELEKIKEIVNERNEIIKNSEKKGIEEATRCYEQSASKDVVMISHPALPWREALCDTDAKFVIYETSNGQVNLQAVPPEVNSFEKKIEIPQNIFEGIQQKNFIHKAGFICGITPDEGMTKAEAIQLLESKAEHLVSEQERLIGPEMISAIKDKEAGIDKILASKSSGIAEQAKELKEHKRNDITHL